MKKLKALLTAPIFPIAYLLIQTAISGIVAFAASFGFAFSGDAQSGAQAAAQFTMEHALELTAISGLITLAAVAAWILGTRRRLGETLRLGAPDAVSVLVCLILGVAANALVSGLMSLIPIPQSLIDEYENLVGNTLTGGSPVMSILVVGLLVPVVEETVFRGMAMHSLREGFGPAAAVFFSSVIFAAAHIIPLQMAFVFPVALILGLTFIWTDNLWCAVAVHVGFNMTSSLISVFAESASESTEAGAAIVLAAAGAAVAAACMYALRRRRAAPGADNDG